MTVLHRIWNWFADVGRDPVLALAQDAQMHRQVPLLYGLLLINSIAIAYTFDGLAPSMLTISVPMVLFSAASIRLIYWLRVRAAPTALVARRRLRAIMALSVLFGFSFVSWSMLLLPYGGPFEQAHMALYVSTTVIGCIFCLIHLPQAAVLIAVCVLPVFGFTLGHQQEVVFAPLAVNVVLVLLVLLRVLFKIFASFSGVIEARAKLAVQRDELVRLNEVNRCIALTDSLTQLANRRCFYDDLEAVTRDPIHSGCATVGIIDLDRFKPVNDTFGHHVGDELLKEVAARLRRAIAPFGELYRLGGDEFGMILHLNIDQSRILGERICEVVAAPILLQDRQVTVGASIGLASLTEAALTGTELAERADYALYHAKRTRPGSYAVFSRELEREIRSDQLIEVELQSSSFEDELDVHVQPIIDSATHEIVGGEILLRWCNARLGNVEPERFIAVAERSNLIHRITLTVVAKAVETLALLPEPMSIAINMSARDLTSREVVDGVVDAVRRAPGAASRLWIEVTETAATQDIEAAIEALSVFRANGIKIALDDFGTGYSSLSNLHRLPLDRVKIDRSFASDLTGRYSRSIVKAVVGMCRALQLSCIAEGVETEDQARLLQGLGCELLQGFFFSRPVPLGAFVALAVGDRTDWCRKFENARASVPHDERVDVPVSLEDSRYRRRGWPKAKPRRRKQASQDMSTPSPTR